MLHAIIMAGGAGTRFWPASRVARPKQLLNLLGPRSMIQASYDRLGDLVAPERVRVLTNCQLVDAIRQQLPQLSAEAVLGEPCKRDTAPCVGLAALLAARQDPDATMVVLPADHVIEPAQRFRDSIRWAAELVQRDPGRLITFGIKPAYPAEVYGYIQRGSGLSDEAATDSLPTYQVARFREKPDRQTAEQYVASGDYFWNSGGIFVWKAGTILAALQEFEPAMYQRLDAIGQACDTPSFAAVLQREFSAIVGKSIDYAVMEKHADVVVIEAPYTWDDLGNWQALARLRGGDQDQNTCIGRHLAIDTHNSILCGDQQHLLVTVGMKDCIVVRTEDATLVADRSAEELLRQIVPRLQQLGWEEYL